MLCCASNNRYFDHCVLKRSGNESGPPGTVKIGSGLKRVRKRVRGGSTKYRKNWGGLEAGPEAGPPSTVKIVSGREAGSKRVRSESTKYCKNWGGLEAGPEAGPRRVHQVL